MRWLWRLRGSPEAIGRGVAVGLLVAFTPTIGFQTLLALGAASLVNANRPAALVPTWLTNPLTAAPVYGFTYSLGSVFWPGPAPATVAAAMINAARELESLDFLELRAQLDIFLALGRDVFIAMWIGGLIVGGIAALIAYPITVRTIVDLRAMRAKRRQARRERRRNPS